MAAVAGAEVVAVGECSAAATTTGETASPVASAQTNRDVRMEITADP